MPCTIEPPHKVGDSFSWHCCNCGFGLLNLSLNTHCTDCSHQRCPPCLLDRNTGDASRLALASTPQISAQESTQVALLPGNFLPPSQAISEDFDSNIHTSHDHSPASGLAVIREHGDGKFGLWSVPEPEDVKNLDELDEAFIIEDDVMQAKQPGQDRIQGRVFACPFLKNDPDIHRHRKSCCRPYTLTQLREHLIGKRSGQKKDNVKKVRSDEGLRGPHLLDEGDDHYPAEGVGPRQVSMIKKLNIPRGPQGETGLAQREALWRSWYSALFGKQAPILNCYFDEADIIPRADQKSVERSRDRLKAMFARSSPMEQKVRALRLHCATLWAAEMRCLKTSIHSEDFEKACSTIGSPLRRSRSVKDRRGTTESLSLAVPTHNAPHSDATPEPWSTYSSELTAFAPDHHAALGNSFNAIQDFDFTLYPPEQSDFANPWAISNTQEDLVSRHGVEVGADLIDISWMDSSPNVYEQSIPIGSGQMISTLPNSTFFQSSYNDPDAMHPAYPELKPVNQQCPSPTESPSQGNRDPYDKVHKAVLPETMEHVIRQPACTHGKFMQDLLDPRNEPSYNDMPRPPPSADFETFGSLFEPF